MTVVSLRGTSVHAAVLHGPSPGRSDAARAVQHEARTAAARCCGATVVIEDDGRLSCAENARARLVATGLFERDTADRAAIRPHAAVRGRLDALVGAARDGERPSALIWAPTGAAYLANAGLVPYGEREVVSLDIRPLAPPMWSNRDLADAFGLTEREADVTRCLLLGDPVPSIAARLRLKTATVRHYLKLIYSKTSTASQAQLVAMLAGGLQRDGGGGGEAGIVSFPGRRS